MDLSVDIKTLIVQHVSLVLPVLPAGPISLVFPKYGITEGVIPGCRAASSVTGCEEKHMVIGKA